MSSMISTDFLELPITAWMVLLEGHLHDPAFTLVGPSCRVSNATGSERLLIS
jgi:hypothetical protein